MTTIWIADQSEADLKTAGLATFEQVMSTTAGRCLPGACRPRELVFAGNVPQKAPPADVVDAARGRAGPFAA